VVRNIRDSVPKIIGHFLVRAVQNKMQIELFKRLGQMFDAVNKAMGEPIGIIQERKALIAQLETLRKAERVLTRDPEITSLIGTTDDDLLFELRKEKAEGGKGPSDKELEDKFLKPVIPENDKSPVNESHSAHPAPSPASIVHAELKPGSGPLQHSPAVTSPATAPPKAPSPEVKNQPSVKPVGSTGGKPGLFGK